MYLHSYRSQALAHKPTTYGAVSRPRSRHGHGSLEKGTTGNSWCNAATSGDKRDGSSSQRAGQIRHLRPEVQVMSRPIKPTSMRATFAHFSAHGLQCSIRIIYPPPLPVQNSTRIRASPMSPIRLFTGLWRWLSSQCPPVNAEFLMPKTL